MVWRAMGWQTVAYAEIEPFPCAHLAHHYPEVPNLGDVTQITEARVASLGPIDVLTFGSPCQDFSVAGTLDARPRGSGFPGTDGATAGHVVGVGPDIARCVATREGSSLDYETTTMIAQPICFDTTQITRAKNYSRPKANDPCHPLARGQHAPAIATPSMARRLTPRECERLQGMPDGYTLIPFNKKPAADGPRYRALGNSAATTVLKWIGKQIELALWCEGHL